MTSLGQAVARQSNRWFEPFVVALAIAAIVITLAVGAFSALSAPSTDAPSRTTTQILQEPGLLDQRQGERGGAVIAAPAYNPWTDPALREHRRGERSAVPSSAPGNPYVNIHTPSVDGTIVGPGMQEHGRGELEF